MNKLRGLVISAFAAIIGFIGLASAQFDTRNIADSVIRFYEDFFGPIFRALFGQYSTDEFLFAKVLIFILLTMVISFTLQKSGFLGKKRGLTLLIALIISILAIRYLPESDLISGILLPYGVLGIALMTFLPFLIYFFFVHKSVPGGFGRRAAWAVYGIVFLVLLSFRWDKISSASEWIYIIGIILVVLAFLFDKTIHGYFETSKISGMEERITRRAIINLLDEYKKAVNVGDFSHAERVARELRDLGYTV